MRRLRRSWRLARASWAVMLTHRSLLVYPIVSSSLVAILGGFLPLALVWAHLVEENADSESSVRGVVAIAIIYVVTATVVLFFNLALVAEVIARFDGLPRATPSGWSVAVSGLRGIVPHAVFGSGLASLAFLVLGRAGTWLAIRGAAALTSWSEGAFLAVPVLVAERVGPREALERGACLLRATWGDRAIGGFGFTVVKILLVALVIAVGILLIVLTALTEYAPLVLVVVIVVIAAVTFMLVTGSAVSMVYSTATYRHVTNRPVPGFEALDEMPGISPADDDPAGAPNVA